MRGGGGEGGLKRILQYSVKGKLARAAKKEAGEIGEKRSELAEIRPRETFGSSMVVYRREIKVGQFISLRLGF